MPRLLLRPRPLKLLRRLLLQRLLLRRLLLRRLLLRVSTFALCKTASLTSRRI
jgi:hypothetical protein